MSAMMKRKKYLIDKDFQIKFIVKFCAVVIISSAMIGGLIFYLTRNSTTVAIENTRVLVKSTADFILPVVALTVLAVTILSSIVLAVLALIVSHRIAGPLYRLRREIDSLSEGDFTRQFRVRNKDHLKDLAKSLGLMSNALRQKHADLKKKSEALQEFLRQRNYCVSFEDKDRFARMLKEIDGILGNFKV